MTRLGAIFSCLPSTVQIRALVLRSQLTFTHSKKLRPSSYDATLNSGAQALFCSDISPAKLETTSGPYIAMHDGKDSLVVSWIRRKSAKMDNNFVPLGVWHLSLFVAAHWPLPFLFPLNDGQLLVEPHVQPSSREQSNVGLEEHDSNALGVIGERPLVP